MITVVAFLMLVTAGKSLADTLQISTLEKPGGVLAAVGPNIAEGFEFRTDNHSYALENVTVSLERGGSYAPTSQIHADLYLGDATGRPLGSSLVTLSTANFFNFASFQPIKFRPDFPITLLANTRYFFALSALPTTTDVWQVEFTPVPNGYDLPVGANWSMYAGRAFNESGSTGWFSEYDAYRVKASVSAAPLPAVISGAFALGDFNADGKVDVLLANTVTGDHAIWFMNGTSIGTNAFAGTVPVDWMVSGVGDFNGDGKADLFWVNTVTGDRTVWLMNGSTKTAGGYLGAVPVAWAVSGIGDFNGDGKKDILWTNTLTGERAIWLMNGAAMSAGTSLGVIPLAWTVSGAGDFDGDGKDDILLSNTMTGDRVIWFMNGTSIKTNAFVGTVPVAWVISGTGDFDADGKADIFWSNTETGDRAVWLMNGNAISAGGYLGSVPVAWIVSGTGDFNGDGRKDIFWTNTVTGERAIWLMNGIAKSEGSSLGVVPVEWTIH